MGAHSLYAAQKPWQALEYLVDLQFRIKDYETPAAFGAEVTARANAAREWVDVLEADKRLKAAAVAEIADQVEARGGRGRSASLEAIRKLILERARNNNQIYQASNARPW